MRTLSDRFGQATNRLYPHVVHRAGAELSAVPATGGLSLLEGRRYCTIVTFRQSGEPIATPVWFGLGERRLYFRSLAGAAKLRRVARDSKVLVAPCTARGRPLGPPFAGRARILSATEATEAEHRIQANYGAVRRVYERAIRDADARYVEVTPAEA